MVSVDARQSTTYSVAKFLTMISSFATPKIF